MDEKIVMRPQEQQVSVLLFIGIVFLPIVFVWALLRPGYSKVARVFGFGWLILFFMVACSSDDKNDSQKSGAPEEKVEVAESLIGIDKTSNKEGEVPVADRPETISKEKYEIDAIAQRLDDNSTYLKKYYATKSMLDQASQDMLRLSGVTLIYSYDARAPQGKALAKRARALAPRLSEQSRQIFASIIEEGFIKAGMDVQAVAQGTEKKTLKIKYALMGKPMVYKFENDAKISEQAGALGFKKVVYTNGFESSLGMSWTVDI